MGTLHATRKCVIIFGEEPERGTHDGVLIPVSEIRLCLNDDLRHGLIGAGVYASHGYERSHRDGAENTLRLLIGYTL